MDSSKFITLCKETIIDYFKENSEITDNKDLTEDDIYVVWSCKTLQNNKALLSTNVTDGMYYELTYNGDKEELYLDAYKKWKNKCIENIKENGIINKDKTEVGAFINCLARGGN